MLEALGRLAMALGRLLAMIAGILFVTLGTYGVLYVVIEVLFG